MAILAKLKQRARHVRAEAIALYFAARDPRTPWYAKLLVVAIVAYALSPIDLIPDFVPLLGYLDDLVLIPLGIALAIRWIPQPVLAECRARARETIRIARSAGWIVGAIIVMVWVVVAALFIAWVRAAFLGPA